MNPRTLVLALVAIAMEGAAAFAATRSTLPAFILVGLLCHACAAVASYLAALYRTGSTPVERFAVLVTALCVPLFGPVIAWTIPSGGSRGESDSVTMLEGIERSFEEDRAPQEGDDVVRILARQSSVLGYQQVLRRGGLEHKRNALRRLTRSGEPHHLARVHELLDDPEPELRLCAHQELDRVKIHHERRVAELDRRARAASEPDIAPLLELARAHMEFGASGLLDPEMALVHLETAAELAQQGLDRRPDDWHATAVAADAFCRLGRHAAAECLLAALPQVERESEQARLLSARVGFGCRDFERVRRETNALVADGSELPHWLRPFAAAKEEPA